jgi:hypothetical protein
MSNRQPDPSPPEFRPTQPPSWLVYLLLTAISIAFIKIAFSIGSPDWSGLLINLAAGIITTIMFLIIIDRKFRKNEFSEFRVKSTIFTTQLISLFSADIADTVGYAKVFTKQIQTIRPTNYIERSEIDNLLEKYPNGYYLTGEPGSGKTTSIQNVALNISEKIIINPKGKKIPVIIPVRNWRSGNIVEQVYKEIEKYYPVRQRVIQKWLKRKPMLLIFDGLDEHSNPDIVMIEIETLRKLANNITVIVTSRSLQQNTDLPIMTLSVLPENETTTNIVPISNLTETIDRLFNSFYKKAQALFTENNLATGVKKKGASNPRSK